MSSAYHPDDWTSRDERAAGITAPWCDYCASECEWGHTCGDCATCGCQPCCETTPCPYWEPDDKP